jgi:tRNA dimethylallyltransferase
VDEVAGLIAKYGPELRPLGSVGYKQVLEHLTQGVSWPDTEAAIVRATLLYARRQRTWWSTDPSVSRRIAPEHVRHGEIAQELERFVTSS